MVTHTLGANLGRNERFKKKARDLNSTFINLGFPDGLDGKESACKAEDLRLIPGLGRSPGERNGYPLSSCLETPMNREAWWATVHRVKELQTTE